jgi:hypothetical protein
MFEHNQKFVSTISVPQNSSGIDTWYDAGIYAWKRVDTGFNSGSKSALQLFIKRILEKKIREKFSNASSLLQ